MKNNDKSINRLDFLSRNMGISASNRFATFSTMGYRINAMDLNYVEYENPSAIDICRGHVRAVSTKFSRLRIIGTNEKHYNDSSMGTKNADLKRASLKRSSLRHETNA